MCGIAGFLNLDRRRPADPHVLERMLHVIAHRGPDDQGVLLDHELAQGMRRLSIIDLSGGHQPIFDESGRYAVVCNGEIYNYRELRSELQARGHQLQTHSDTEVIVHLYEELGPECVHQLRGMFAIAVWDSVDRTLWLVRDRLGIKPLYYSVWDSTLIFGSEIKALLQYPGLPIDMDRQALVQYLSLKYVPAPRTLFQGIQSLPPGHSLRCRQGRIDVQPYWDVEFHTLESEQDLRAYEEQLETLLQESVRLHLRSDVPFGAFLSGGVDSSTIVALMSQLLSEPVKTFSVGFEGGDSSDELPYARQVAQRFGTEHHEIIVRGSDFRELSETVIWHLDQPIADQATMATYMVARLAAQHVKMVLTGEGGDELFAGYARYSGERFAKWFAHVPESVKRCLRKSLPFLPGLRRPKLALYALTWSEEAMRFVQWFPLLNLDQRQALLVDDPCAVGAEDPARGAFAERLSRCRASDALSRMLYTDTKLWLPDYLLLRGDKLTMAHSLEARVPLLDHRLVEFAAQVPGHWKLHGTRRKHLLKQVAAKWLPPEIVDRAKQGFPIPIDRWLRYECRDWVRDLLSPARIRRRGLFQEAQVMRLVRRHESGYADHSSEIWGLCSLELWCERFLDGAGAPVEPTTGRIPSLHGNGIRRR